MPHLTAFRREATPARWHFRANARIPAFVGVADVGWQVLPRAALRLRPQAFVGGEHGYDNAEAAMGGILIAAGPAFRRGAAVAALSSVHVYQLLCRAAGLRPARNDGSPDSVAGFFRRPPTSDLRPPRGAP
jgi:hypothetical protein